MARARIDSQDLPISWQYQCPVEACLDVVGGKWKGVILFHLLAGTQRFGQLRRMLSSVTPRVLSQQLRELEADGLIDRKDFHTVPPRVDYSLTPLGATLEPLLRLMRAWGTAHTDAILANKLAARQVTDGDAAAIPES